MAKAKLKKIDWEKLPDPLKAEYEEVDGEEDTYRLKVEPVDGLQLANVGELQTAISKERQAAKDAKKLLKSFEGLDPQAARDALEQIKAITEAGGTDEQTKKKMEVLEKQLTDKYGNQAKQLTANWDKEKGDLTKKLTTTQSQLRNLLVTVEAQSAISKRGAKERMLLPTIEKAVRVTEKEDGSHRVEILGKDGNPRLNPKGSSADDLMTIDQLVEELSSDEDFSAAFPAKGGGGGGAQGSGKKGTSQFTLSEADASDPAKYRTAKAAAEKAGQTLQLVP